MFTQAPEISRGESRYAVGDLGAARVLVERPDVPGAPTAAAQMVDLSLGGVRLALEEPLKFSEQVRLRIEHDQLPLNLALNATVRWIRSTAGDRWTAGCSFSPALPPGCLNELFEKGVLERRRSRRHAVRGRLDARWELNSGPTPVELLDLSTGGFAIRCPEAVGLGGWMQVSVPRPDGTQRSCESKVQWCLESGGAFAVGCEFVASSGFAVVQEAAERVPLEEPAERVPTPRRNGMAVEAWLLAAIAVAGAVTWCLSR